MLDDTGKSEDLSRVSVAKNVLIDRRVRRMQNAARTICAIRWYSAGNFSCSGEASMGFRSPRLEPQLFGVAGVLAALFVLAGLIPARAQDKNPLAKDPNAAKLG